MPACLKRWNRVCFNFDTTKWRKFWADFKFDAQGTATALPGQLLLAYRIYQIIQPPELIWIKAARESVLAAKKEKITVDRPWQWTKAMHSGTRVACYKSKEEASRLVLSTVRIDWLLLFCTKLSTCRVTSKRGAFSCVFSPFLDCANFEGTFLHHLHCRSEPFFASRLQ